MGFINKIVGMSGDQPQVEVGGTATCDHCGRAFDLDATKSEYASHYNGEAEYDDIYFDGTTLCASCAIQHSDEAYDAGRAYDYSLNTGKPPEDMPDDWTMSKDD